MAIKIPLEPTLFAKIRLQMTKIATLFGLLFVGQPVWAMDGILAWVHTALSESTPISEKLVAFEKIKSVALLSSKQPYSTIAKDLESYSFAVMALARLSRFPNPLQESAKSALVQGRAEAEGNIGAESRWNLDEIQFQLRPNRLVQDFIMDLTSDPQTTFTSHHRMVRSLVTMFNSRVPELRAAGYYWMGNHFEGQTPRSSFFPQKFTLEEWSALSPTEKDTLEREWDNAYSGVIRHAMVSDWGKLVGQISVAAEFATGANKVRALGAREIILPILEAAVSETSPPQGQAEISRDPQLARIMHYRKSIAKRLLIEIRDVYESALRSQGLAKDERVSGKDRLRIGIRDLNGLASYVCQEKLQRQ